MVRLLSDTYSFLFDSLNEMKKNAPIHFDEMNCQFGTLLKSERFYLATIRTFLWNDFATIARIIRLNKSIRSDNKRLLLLQNVQRHMRRFLVWYPWKVITQKRFDRRPMLISTKPNSNHTQEQKSKSTSMLCGIKYKINRPGNYMFADSVLDCTPTQAQAKQVDCYVAFCVTSPPAFELLWDDYCRNHLLDLLGNDRQAIDMWKLVHSYASPNNDILFSPIAVCGIYNQNTTLYLDNSIVSMRDVVIIDVNNVQYVSEVNIEKLTLRLKPKNETTFTVVWNSTTTCISHDYLSELCLSCNNTGSTVVGIRNCCFNANYERDYGCSGWAGQVGQKPEPQRQQNQQRDQYHQNKIKWEKRSNTKNRIPFPKTPPNRHNKTFVNKTIFQPKQTSHFKNENKGKGMQQKKR